MRPRLPDLRRFLPLVTVLAALLLAPAAASAGEADLILPDLTHPTNNPEQNFFGMSGQALLTVGLAVAALGIVFGLMIYMQLKRLPVHRTMLEVSDLIYETCKTYLLTQGKFIMILWVCIAAVMIAYFGFLSGDHPEPAAQSIGAVATEVGAELEGATQPPAASPAGAPLEDYSKPTQVSLILFFSIVGIAGSYAVAWFGMRV